ncbi:hypothetical protein FOE78_14360 [Microlunatus elymi]|uniref:Uncharacterized protein n=1 Tax=Microlunatus elymi TaxID=2596828 RepID=A0A516Q152_9ACTN|nr:hypothetical protein [Microlunatus elymi]QDP96941.1 hypothetical protein FOE78_14360 [Microlunatus elymi]
MKNRRSAVALVESPAQLLNVIEWAHSRNRSAACGAGMSIMILPPPEPAARVQLDRMTELATEVGFSVSWHEIRGGHGARIRALRAIRAHVAQAATVVIGDPFSGVLQLVINFVGRRRLVVVDDGSATIEFTKIINDGGTLTRWHRSPQATALNRQLAARARRRLAGSSSAQTEVFTAMPVHSSQLLVRRNDLGWTRQRFGPPRLLPGADLVGSSLVESSVLDEDHYLQAVRRLAAAHDVRRYLAHRRESVEKLAKINDLGLTVIRPDLPLELFARLRPISERVISFPSTVVHTLPVALRDTSVEVLVCDIDRQWLSSGRSAARTESFLTSVNTTARRTHGLEAVARP